MSTTTGVNQQIEDARKRAADIRTPEDAVAVACLLASAMWRSNSLRDSRYSAMHPNDCFCKEGGFWKEDGTHHGAWQNDGAALRDLVEIVARATA